MLLYDEEYAEENTLFSRVHATLQPALSVGWLVSRSVGQSVGRSVSRLVGHTLLFLGLHFFDRTATAQMVW